MRRILVLVDHKENRHLLAEWLAKRYEVATTADVSDLNAAFDLAIVDGTALSRLWKTLHERKEIELPCFLPILLITSRQDVGLITRQLWKTIDELILSPIEKSELMARVEILLRTRHCSLELRDKNFELEKEIVQRQQVEAALRISEQQYRDLAESMPLNVLVSQPDGNVDYANKSWLQHTGLTLEETQQAGWQLALHPEDRQEWMARWHEALDTGEPREAEFRLRYADGSYRWQLAQALPMRDDQGAILRWINTSTDIDSQKQAQLDISDLYNQVKSALQLRDDFLSIAAHELKTPVTSMRGFSQALLRQMERQGSVDPVRMQTALQTIEQQSFKLAYLMNQLLDISRVEAGRLILDRQPTDLRNLIFDTVKTLERPQHPISIRVDSAIEINVDPIRFEQVLVNLLDNAAKYSPDDAPIEIDLTSPTLELVEIAIRDHGIGIPVEHRDHIFERFYQAHGNGYQGGMGLGLYISYQIIQLHGGTLTAEFPDDGGTRFIITLPVTSEDQPVS